MPTRGAAHLLVVLLIHLTVAGGFSVARAPRFHSQLTMSKGGRVCIVGGGLAGLVSGKECLKAGLRPTIFESAQAVGGMWNPALERCYKSLTANLSKFTCSFSDFPWPASAAMFPSQADLGRYLMSYKESFLEDASFELGSRITEVRPTGGGKFEVKWTDASDKSQSAAFDKVIVASGFFSRKVQPAIEGMDSFTGTCIHSGDYRAPDAFAGKRVAVVGSSFSSAEIAAEIAPVASTVLNILPKKSWVVPRYIPLDPRAPNTAFVPIDLLLYRRRAASSAPRSTAEFNAWKTEYLRSLFGSSEPDPLHAFRAPEDAESPPFVGVADTYANLCRAGRIVPIQGRLAKVANADCVVANPDAETAAAETKTLSGIDAIVLCTGFEPELGFLGEEVLAGAGYEEADAFCPLRLYRNVVHPSLHSLAFVGMYRGPYFGVTEMQARLAAAVFSGGVAMPGEGEIEEDLRRIDTIRAQQPRLQFPFPDYVGEMDATAKLLGHPPRADLRPEDASAVPQQYGSEEAAAEANRRVEEEMEGFRGGKHVAASIVRALHGRWKFERQLNSRLQGSPSGTVTGEIEFQGARGSVAGEEDLDYIEKGLFATSFGAFDVTAQYLYCYNPETDSLDVYFGPPDPRKQRLFVRLRCTPGEGGWKAAAEHRCGEDDYDADYHFTFDGLSLREIRIKFKVVGPTKDYTSFAVLTRP